MGSLFGSPDTGPSPAEIAEQEKQDKLGELRAREYRARVGNQRVGVSSLLNTGVQIPGVGGGGSGNGGGGG